MSQRRSYSRPLLSAKNKPKPLQNNNKYINHPSKNSHTRPNIPHIIRDLEKNLKLLKKCYQEQHGSCSKSTYFSIRPSHSGYKRSVVDTGKNKKELKRISSQMRFYEDDPTECLQLDQLKKSFFNSHGYETNNIVELYNYYKKNVEKSTGIFGSVSYTNHPNSINNFSQVHESKLKLGSGIIDETNVFHTTKENIAPNHQSVIDHKSIQNTENIKKNNQLVNVAYLLEQRKKTSRDSLCEKMNQQNLMMQASKKLIRPNVKDNMERNVSLIGIQAAKKKEQRSNSEKSNKLRNIKTKNNGNREGSQKKKQNNIDQNTEKQLKLLKTTPFQPRTENEGDNQHFSIESPIKKCHNSSNLGQSGSRTHSEKGNRKSIDCSKYQKSRQPSNKKVESKDPPAEKPNLSSSKQKLKGSKEKLKKILGSHEKQYDLNKGILFEEQSMEKSQMMLQKVGKSKIKPFMVDDNSLDGCEISFHQNSAKGHLEEISFDF